VNVCLWLQAIDSRFEDSSEVPAFSDKQAIVLLEAVRVALANLRDAEGAAADARMHAMQAAIPVTLAAVEDIDREVAAAAERVRCCYSWGEWVLGT
jgi:hypothetical protein